MLGLDKTTEDFQGFSGLISCFWKTFQVDISALWLVDEQQWMGPGHTHYKVEKYPEFLVIV